MKVLIATPCYISAVSMNYVTSIFELTYAAASNGVDLTLHMHSESLITRGRNEIVKWFLMHEEYTHLFWIDSDIAFSPNQAFRILNSGYDVAAGIYPIKNLNWPANGPEGGLSQAEYHDRYASYPFNPLGHWEERILGVENADGFIEVAEAPTGFMCIKREVFTQMMNSYPELNYMPEGAEKQKDKDFYWLFFDCLVDPVSKRYLSEDYAFCKRWRDIGGRVFVDLHSDFGHLGQYMYRGNLLNSLRLRDG
jgi:hypothetical protein